MSFLQELQRRNVFKVAVAYVLVAWLLLQVSDTLVPALRLPDWFHSGVAFILIIGFPIALVLAWAFELTPEGIKSANAADAEGVAKEPTRALNYVIVAAFVLLLCWLAWEKFAPSAPPPLEGDVTQAAGVAPAEPVAESEEKTSQKSIAVLPFVNMSSDPEQEYFADGISEELLNLLAHTSNLRVISRTSAFSFKGKDQDIPTIARQLDVTHVLEGSVRKSQDSIRITAQLIETATDAHLWSKTYDRLLKDIFAIQDEVAADVVNELHLKLFDQPPRRTTVDPETYALYLEARQIWARSDEADRDRVEAMLDEALARNPDYVDALFLKSDVTLDQAEARNAIDRAVALDPDNAQIKSFMATNLDGLPPQLMVQTAARMIEEAVATDPYDPFVIFNAARVAGWIGKQDLEIRLNEYSADRDPLFFWAQANLGSSYLDNGRVDDAVRQFEAAMRLNANAGAIRWKLGVAQVLHGESEAALETLSLEPDPVYRLQGSAMAYHELGKDAEANSSLEELKTLEIDGVDLQQAWPYGFARLYAMMGQADLAFDFLEKTRLRDGWARFGGLAVNPLFESLHDDPRWEPFLRKVQQHPDQVAAFKFNIEVPK